MYYLLTVIPYEGYDVNYFKSRCDVQREINRIIEKNSESPRTTKFVSKFEDLHLSEEEHKRHDEVCLVLKGIPCSVKEVEYASKVVIE